MIETALKVLSPEAVFRENEPLGRKTTLGVGGVARFYAEPATIEDLGVLLHEARVLEVPVFFLGRGSNLIAVDGAISCLVIRLQHKTFRDFQEVDEQRIRVGAGLRLRDLCGRAMKGGLGGFEFLEGIPGTVGGALRMNAGAMGGWMFEVVEQVRFMTLGGELRELPKEQLNYGYRHCRELEEGCAIDAILRAPSRTESEKIREQIQTYQNHRYETQPKDPSAGCIFKNPAGESAGRIIDELGLKGMAVGAAEVSRMHGNFIINKGGASSQDVLDLIRRIRGEVWRQRGLLLEPEVLLLGRKWDDVL
jgi:UDP-N-acetylmuramate--alanine ligase